MSSLFAGRHAPCSFKPWTLLLLALLVLVLAGCAPGEQAAKDKPTSRPVGEIRVPLPTFAPMPEPHLVDLTLSEDDVSVEPVPLRAGFPFTVTALVQNNWSVPAEDIPVMVLISADQEEIGYTSYTRLLTVTVPASRSLQVDLPVDWNFSGGEHQLWIQVNRLPDAWQDQASTLSEADTRDNIALVDLMIDPFDAYTSDLCSGRVDVEIGEEDVLPEPDQQRVWVRVHNLGNRALYNLPVTITSAHATGISYTPAIPPCGGTAGVYVTVDQPMQEGDLLTVQVNPGQWVGGLEEDDLDNNRAQVTVVAATGPASPPEPELEEYDFSIGTPDIEIPELWHVLVTIHNLGTRDAAMVPITVENEEGRRLTDAVPLVQGEGIGVAAIRIGYLWIPGGTLTFTVNPAEAKGAYPETRRGNNTATFALP